MLVDVKIEADYDDLENKNASPAEGPKRKFVVDATNGAPQGVNASNTRQHLHSRKKGKGSVKRAKLEDNKGATGLGRVQTPVGLFEDECVFCHSFRTSEACHGPMVLYHKRRIVPSDEGNPTNVIYVHEKCMVWAPKVKSHGDTFKNVESEIRRASGFKCSRCKIQGAALRCYSSHCRSTYHVPCAMMIPECRWDIENRYVWCPKHAPSDEISSPKMESDILSPILQNQCPAKEISVDCQMEDNHIALPGDEMRSPVIESDITSAILQNQCPAKEISGDCQMEDEHMDPLITSNSSLPSKVPGQCLVKEGISVVNRKEDLQVDQLNTSSSSLPQGRCSDKERISANYRREENLVNQFHTPVDQWVLLGVSLSASEKDSLKKFASLTSSNFAEEWDKNVTHVIVGRNTGHACDRSYEVLMAILSGKWVVSAGWIVDCLVEPVPGPKTSLAKLIPGPEISYEMNLYDGPRKGRARAAEGAPKLFSGLHFCLSAYMDPEDKETIQKLVTAGEGRVLDGISPDWSHENLKRNPSEVYFIYDFCPPRNVTPDFDLILGKEIHKSKELGAQVISYTRLFDAILWYNAAMGPVGSGRTQLSQRRPAK